MKLPVLSFLHAIAGTIFHIMCVYSLQMRVVFDNTKVQFPFSFSCHALSDSVSSCLLPIVQFWTCPQELGPCQRLTDKPTYISLICIQNFLGLLVI